HNKPTDLCNGDDRRNGGRRPSPPRWRTGRQRPPNPGTYASCCLSLVKGLLGPVKRIRLSSCPSHANHRSVVLFPESTWRNWSDFASSSDFDKLATPPGVSTVTSHKIREI